MCLGNPHDLHAFNIVSVSQLVMVVMQGGSKLRLEPTVLQNACPRNIMNSEINQCKKQMSLKAAQRFVIPITFGTNYKYSSVNLAEKSVQSCSMPHSNRTRPFAHTLITTVGDRLILSMHVPYMATPHVQHPTRGYTCWFV